MFQLIPAILTDSFEEFLAQIKKCFGLFPYVQLDVMDGKFVPNKSFDQIENIKSADIEMPIELHLMVNEPVEEMRKWQQIENVFRVIFHVESPSDPLRSISFARKEGWEVGIALNPETSLKSLDDLIERVDFIQFMTVHPGKHGAPFVDDTILKIQEFRAKFPEKICTIDGAINRETVPKFKGLKIDTFNVGSALVLAEDVKQAKKELEEVIKNNL